MDKRRLISIAIVGYIVWLLMNWSIDIEVFIIGLPFSILVAFLAENIPVFKRSNFIFEPWRYGYFFLQYIPVFVWENIKANFDVAYRVIHPKMPIRPAVVRVHITLSTDIGLTILANTVSLVPGLTSVDIDREKGILYVHCMAVPVEHPDEIAKKMVEKFEKILIKVFE